MISTDKLRILLDERGVKWWEGEDERTTCWKANGLTWEYFNNENGDAWLGFLGAYEQDITPEQAIAATLGKTCKNIKQDYPSLFECSECNWECADTYCCDSEFNYCPSCGAKVIN